MMLRAVFSTSLLSVLATVVAISGGCHRSSSPDRAPEPSTVPSTPEAPSGLSYATPTATYLLGQSIAPNFPTLAAGEADSYSIDPALPAGLGLDATTGVIAGTPSETRPLTTHTVTASGPGGTTSVTIEVAVVNLPPDGLAYSDPVPVYRVAMPIPPNTPSSRGGPVTQYEVTPGLPGGLTLDATTGVISGTPLAQASPADHTVRAIGPGGETSTVLTITVLPEPPASVDYGALVVFCEGEVGVVDPVVTGGVPTSFTIDPALPPGLSIGPVSGRIEGAPTAVLAPTPYTVTAFNPGGQATAQFDLAIEPIACALDYPEPDRVIVPSVFFEWTPIIDCTSVAGYVIDPPLPAGLGIDPSSGVISGTPMVETPRIEYQVTADGACGPVATTIALRVSPRYVVATPDATGTFDSGTGIGSVTQPITLLEDDLNPAFPHGVGGFVLVLGHDPQVLVPQQGGFSGTDLAALNGGLGPDFFSFQIGSTSVAVVSVFSFTGADVLICDASRTLASLQYACVPATFLGLVDPVETQLTFLPSAAFDPTLESEVTVSGVAIEPVPQSGVITLSPAP